MGEAELAAAVMQFGTAGLIGWLWITERRTAGTRERQLHEAHDRLMSQESHVRTILSALEANTRALVMLEAGQRDLARVIGGSGTIGRRSTRRNHLDETERMMSVRPTDDGAREQPLGMSERRGRNGAPGPESGG